MKSKCPYCTFNKESTFPFEREGKNWGTMFDESAVIVCDLRKGNYWIETYEDTTPDIKYCPMCGRELNKEV